MTSCAMLYKLVLVVAVIQIFTVQECVSRPQAGDKPHAPNSPHGGGSGRPQVSPEDVLRPLENMADRFLRSETMEVFDSLTARAIESFAKFVDDAGLAVVSLVDRLPQTIDRVADTVDDVVKNADNLGREVAVIVSTPARAVLSSLNPDNNRPARRPKPATQQFQLVRNPAKDIQANAEVLEVIPDSVYDNASPNTNIIKGSSDILVEDGIRRLDELPLEPIEASSTVDLERGTRSSSTAISQGEQVQVNANNLKPARKPNKESPPPRRRRPFDFLSSLGINLRNLDRRRNDGRPQQNERQKNVFERNFENSKTQASIQRLEEEVGGFLGRLLGTVYRNADNIDESLSQGIRRVLGDNLDTTNRPVVLQRSAGAATKKQTTTTTTTPFPFKLDFDDVEPAPVKNSALLLP